MQQPMQTHSADTQRNNTAPVVVLFLLTLPFCSLPLCVFLRSLQRLLQESHRRPLVSARRFLRESRAQPRRDSNQQRVCALLSKTREGSGGACGGRESRGTETSGTRRNDELVDGTSCLGSAQ